MLPQARDGLRHVFAGLGMEPCLGGDVAPDGKQRPRPPFSGLLARDARRRHGAWLHRRHGRMQAVLLHAGVGLMHGAMGLLTATKSEIPLLVMSGESTSFGDDPNVSVEPQWYGGVSEGGSHRFIAPVVKYATHAGLRPRTTTRFSALERSPSARRADPPT